MAEFDCHQRRQRPGRTADIPLQHKQIAAITHALPESKRGYGRGFAGRSEWPDQSRKIRTPQGNRPRQHRRGLRCVRPCIKRKVAIKTLPFIDIDTPLGQEKYQRFQREAQAAARLYHPNIAITFDYGETDAFAYIVMEHVDGQSVRELLEKGRASIDQIRTIMRGLLAGLQHSHDLGVVHRDIKPANILLNKNNEVKITDFGIAHLDGSDLTQLGSQVGTPAYMSPRAGAWRQGGCPLGRLFRRRRVV